MTLAVREAESWRDVCWILLVGAAGQVVGLDKQEV